MHVTQTIRPHDSKETRPRRQVWLKNKMFEMSPLLKRGGGECRGMVGGSQRTMQDRIYPQGLHGEANKERMIDLSEACSRGGKEG